MINYNLPCNLIYLCCFCRWKVSIACLPINGQGEMEEKPRKRREKIKEAAGKFAIWAADSD